MEKHAQGSEIVLICFFPKNLRSSIFCQGQGTGGLGGVEGRKNQRNKGRWNRIGSGGQDSGVALAERRDSWPTKEKRRRLKNSGCERSFILW